MVGPLRFYLLTWDTCRIRCQHPCWGSLRQRSRWCRGTPAAHGVAACRANNNWSLASKSIVYMVYSAWGLFLPRFMTLHLVTLNSIPQVSAQVTSLPRQTRRSLMSVWLWTMFAIFVSSANLFIIVIIEQATSRSFMKTMKARDPRTDPWPHILPAWCCPIQYCAILVARKPALIPAENTPFHTVGLELLQEPKMRHLVKDLDEVQVDDVDGLAFVLGCGQCLQKFEKICCAGFFRTNPCCDALIPTLMA